MQPDLLSFSVLKLMPDPSSLFGFPAAQIDVAELQEWQESNRSKASCYTELNKAAAPKPVNSNYIVCQLLRFDLSITNAQFGPLSSPESPSQPCSRSYLFHNLLRIPPTVCVYVIRGSDIHNKPVIFPPNC